MPSALASGFRCAGRPRGRHAPLCWLTEVLCALGSCSRLPPRRPALAGLLVPLLSAALAESLLPSLARRDGGVLEVMSESVLSFQVSTWL